MGDLALGADPVAPPEVLLPRLAGNPVADAWRWCLLVGAPVTRWACRPPGEGGLPPLRDPGRPRGGSRRRRRRRAPRRRSSAGGGRQGTGADRRAREGRRRPGRRRPRRTQRRRRARSSGSTSAATSCARVWVERAAEIAKEYYLSVTFDRGARQRCSCSRRAAGWTSSRSRRDARRARASHVDPLEGYRPHHGRQLVFGAGIADAEEQRQILEIVARLHRCFAESDAMLCEINPLIVTAAGEVVALDAKVTIDESALFRQPDARGAAGHERGRSARGVRAGTG